MTSCECQCDRGRDGGHCQGRDAKMRKHAISKLGKQGNDKEAYHERDRVGANECEWIRGADKQRKSSEISVAFGQLCYLCIRSFSAEFGVLILLKFIALALGFVPVAVLNFLVVLISQPSDNTEIIDDEFMATGLIFLCDIGHFIDRLGICQYTVSVSMYRIAVAAERSVD